MTTASARTAAQTQPKVSKAMVLIEEYHYYVTVPLPSARLPSLDDKNCLLHALGPAPQGSRVLRVNFEGGPRPGYDFFPQMANSSSGKLVSVTCGVYRTPFQFARQAMSLQHPFDMCTALPDPALEVLARTLIDGPVVVTKSRLKTILTWKQWKKDLEAQEAELHQSMHPHVARVLVGKNLLLMQKIGDSLEWPDTNLHRDMVQGFRLIGEEQPSEVFPVEPKPAMAFAEEFWERALLVKPALWQKVADSPCDKLSQGLFDVTEAEREKGWLSEPKTWQQLEDVFGSRWVPVRRFAVEQRGKLRPIDDLAENGVNETSRPELFSDCVPALVDRGQRHRGGSDFRCLLSPLFHFALYKRRRASSDQACSRIAKNNFRAFSLILHCRVALPPRAYLFDCSLAAISLFARTSSENTYT